MLLPVISVCFFSVNITASPMNRRCAAISPESFVAQAMRNTPTIDKATANPLSFRKRSPSKGIEKAYAKKAEQLYIAVTSDVDVRETARNQVLAATVSVQVKVAMT